MNTCHSPSHSHAVVIWTSPAPGEDHLNCCPLCWAQYNLIELQDDIDENEDEIVELGDANAELEDALAKLTAERNALAARLAVPAETAVATY